MIDVSVAALLVRSGSVWRGQRLQVVHEIADSPVEILVPRRLEERASHGLGDRPQGEMGLCIHNRQQQLRRKGVDFARA